MTTTELYEQFKRRKAELLKKDRYVWGNHEEAERVALEEVVGKLTEERISNERQLCMHR